jgi:hypothetical protein
LRNAGAGRSDDVGTAESSYRASPAYDVVVYDRLPLSLRSIVAADARAPSFYGLLLPRAGSPAMAPRTLDQDTALLLLTLREPGTLPAYLSRRLGARCQDVVRSLVLDGVLEVEREGSFVSGPAALDPESIRTAPAHGPIAMLSNAALRHVQGLELGDRRAIANRLYMYNRVPLTPHWANVLGDARDVLRFLGCEDGPTARRLGHAWMPPNLEHGWIGWNSAHTEGSAQTARTGKLYVSPLCAELPELFRTLVEVLDGLGAPPFKIGIDAVGLLRPDKLVIYFQDVSEMQRCADALVRALRGARVQGVPFTAAASSSGLVSWGIDPPHHPSSPDRATSWRTWIAGQLAGFLTASRAASATDVEPWQFARERIRVLGVDPDTWCSRATLWSGDAEPAQ